MDKILSVNAGSSSLKFKLFEMPKEFVLTEGIIERIGSNDAIFKLKFKTKKHEEIKPILNHKEAVQILINALSDLGIIDNLNEITGVGHRVVHGGEIFKSSTLINDQVIEAINSLSELAPLHNPANLTGIKAFLNFLPQAKAVAVFDTAFHQTIPEVAYLYGTPYEWYEKYGIRKYGFHGTSHKYVSERISSIIGRNDLKVIVCHLGNGSSLCAVKNGLSVDTTMGFTPLAGIVMGTRSGDIDASIIPYIASKTNQTISEIENQLNRQSGFLGISGISYDSREIEKCIEEGNKRCILAHEMFVRKIVSYISSYYVILQGVDAIAFTAGIGENSSLVRKDVLKQLEILGIKLNEEANNTRGMEQEISTGDSKIKCFIIPTNEELVIARDVMRFLN